MHSPRRRRNSHQCVESQSHNAVHSNLYKLPPELLDVIHRYLTTDASIALSLTCARFYHSSVLAGVRQDLVSTKTAHFSALCLLERDGVILGYCCRGCLRRHSSGAFSQDELEKRPSERYCLMTKKCVNLGTRTEFSFCDIERIIRQSKKMEPLPIRLPEILTKLFSSPVVFTKTTMRIIPVRAATKNRFVTLCTRLNFPLCPHMRLGDKKVTELYWSGLFSTWISSRRHDRSHNCKSCKTQITLTRSSSTDYGDEWFMFRINRIIGRLLSPLEPTWLAHSFASKDPGLDDFLNATSGWLQTYWTHPHTNLDGLEYFQPIIDQPLPQSPYPQRYHPEFQGWVYASA